MVCKEMVTYMYKNKEIHQFNQVRINCKKSVEQQPILSEIGQLLSAESPCFCNIFLTTSQGERCHGLCALSALNTQPSFFFHFSVSAVIRYSHEQAQSFLNPAKSAKEKVEELNIPADRKSLELVCPQWTGLEILLANTEFSIHIWKARRRDCWAKLK